MGLIEGGFRNSNLEPGDALGNTALNVVLGADNQIINPLNKGMIRLGSDSATAANRTFSLTNGSIPGQILYIEFFTGASTSAQLASSANMSLTETWEPIQGGVLQLIWDPLNVSWYEVSRNDYSGGIADLDARVTVLEGDVATLQGDVTTLDGDVSTIQGDVTTLQGQVLATPYTPSAGSDWVDPDPTTLQEAVDRMAAVVASLNSGPIA